MQIVFDKELSLFKNSNVCSNPNHQQMVSQKVYKRKIQEYNEEIDVKQTQIEELIKNNKEFIFLIKTLDNKMHALEKFIVEKFENGQQVLLNIIEASELKMTSSENHTIQSFINKTMSVDIKNKDFDILRKGLQTQPSIDNEGRYGQQLVSGARSDVLL